MKLRYEQIIKKLVENEKLEHPKSVRKVIKSTPKLEPVKIGGYKRGRRQKSVPISADKDKRPAQIYDARAVSATRQPEQKKKEKFRPKKIVAV